MKTRIIFFSLLLASACTLEVPDLNNPSLDTLEVAPSRPKFEAAAIGLLAGNRLDYAESNGYVTILGVLGREAYNFDTADPRYIEELLSGPGLDPGSPRFGGNFWVQPYQNIRAANIILNALDLDEARPFPVLTAEEMETLRGYVKTMQALDFSQIISTRGENGAPIDVNRDPRAPLAEIVSEADVLAHISSLLDQARGHLEGGTSFAFRLPSGFASFNRPETFVQFNRALRARINVYQGDFEAAEAALNESFIAADAMNPRLAFGVYHSYGTGKGDRRNGLIDSNIYAHPGLMTDAELKTDGSIDNRAAQKLFVREDPRKLQGLDGVFGFAVYQNPKNESAPVPIIRNEELILLRAEVAIARGDIPAAAADLNFIRVHGGGLAAREDLTTDNVVSELLKQRRYSLLFEAGHRWIDMRRFDRMGELPLDQPGHKVHTAFPIPIQEIDPRAP